MSPNRNFGDWHRSRYICTLLPGTAAGVAQVFLPAGARDFPVPCSDPPRHRAHAIPDHPPSSCANPTPHGKARNTGLESPVHPPTRMSALRLPLSKASGAATMLGGCCGRGRSRSRIAPVLGRRNVISPEAPHNQTYMIERPPQHGFGSKRHGRYVYSLLRPRTAALPDRARPRAQKRDFPRSSAQPNVYDRKATSARLRQQATRPLRLFVAAAGDGRAPNPAQSSLIVLNPG
jgi:hypothetical protein